MSGASLRAMLKARPFQPFTLHLADGSELRVAHPDLIYRSPAGETLFVYTDGELNVVATDLVTKMTFPEARGRGRGRGKPRPGVTP